MLGKCPLAAQSLLRGRDMRFKDGTATSLEIEIRREMDRYNARLRHCASVTSGVLEQALKVWEELWDDCQDPRSPEEIIDGKPFARGDLPVHGWPGFLERLHLLGHYLDYAQRLLAGDRDPQIGHPGDENEREEDG